MLCACFSRACGRGGVWFARFLVVFRAVWCGCPLPFSAVVVGGLSVVVLVVVWWGVWAGRVYSLALTRSRLTDSRKTAHGSRLAGVRLLAVGVRVGGGVRPSNLIFLALIIFAVWWGVFYSQTATEKRRTVCVRSLSLPRPFFRTPNTSVR